MSSVSGSGKNLIPAIVVVIALTGFMVTSFLHLNRELQLFKTEVHKTQQEMNNQIATQGEKILLREASIRAMSDDLSKKSEKLEMLENSLSTDRETTRKFLSSVDESFAAQRGMIEDIQRKNKELDARMKTIQETQEFARGNSEQQIKSLQRDTAEIKRQMLLMRENVLMNPASSSQSQSVPLDPSAIPAPSQN